MNRLIGFLVYTTLLLGCMSVADQAADVRRSLGVDAGEQAAICVTIRAEHPNPFLSVVVEAKAVEIPGNVDFTNVPAADLPALLQAIDNAICP